MPTIGPMIAASARLGIAYAQRLCVGIEPADFARFARVGDHIIESNHPAFICGHLSLYPCRILQDLGHDASEFEPSPRYQELFSKDAKCADDPAATIYPGMTELTSKLLAGSQAVCEALETASDDLLTVPNSNEVMRSRFPTQGAMHAFYTGGHFMVHMGQLSAWRRAMGLPAA